MCGQKLTYDGFDLAFGVASSDTSYMGAKRVADHYGFRQFHSVLRKEVDHARNKFTNSLNAIAGPNVTLDANFAPIDDDDVVIAMLEIGCENIVRLKVRSKFDVVLDMYAFLSRH